MVYIYVCILYVRWRSTEAHRPAPFRFQIAWTVNSYNKRRHLCANCVCGHGLSRSSPSITSLVSGLNFVFSKYIYIFFSIPFIIFALLSSLPSSRNSDPGSHRRLFIPPTHYGSCLAFLAREDFSSFFPRRLDRVESCLPMLAALSS